MYLYRQIIKTRTSELIEILTWQTLQFYPLVGENENLQRNQNSSRDIILFLNKKEECNG